MEPIILPYRLRTARQKKRLQKADFDKQLLRMQRLEKAQSRALASLPMIPLEVPYQRGWERTFMLREDVKRSDRAPFYEALLAKINTVQYHPDKAFKNRQRRKHRKIGFTVTGDQKQYLQSFTERAWNSQELTLTDIERQLFYPKEIRDPKTLYLEIVYEFIEPWQYVLRIRPHIITHVKLVDNVLQQEISELDNRIKHHHLRPAMNRASGDGNHWWGNREGDNPKYKDNFKNIPLHVLLNDCSKEQTTQ